MVRFNGIAMASVVAVISACLTPVFSENPLPHLEVKATAEPTTKPGAFTDAEGQTEALTGATQYLPDANNASFPNATFVGDIDHPYVEFDGNSTIVGLSDDDEAHISAVLPSAMLGVDNCKLCYVNDPDAVWCAPQSNSTVNEEHKFETTPDISGGCFPKGTDCNKVVIGTPNKLVPTPPIKTHYSVTAIPKDDEACTDVVRSK